MVEYIGHSQSNQFSLGIYSNPTRNEGLLFFSGIRKNVTTKKWVLNDRDSFEINR
jgi:hypothetical protein